MRPNIDKLNELDTTDIEPTAHALPISNVLRPDEPGLTSKPLGPDGVLALTFPMGEETLPGIASEDIGKCALGVFKRPELTVTVISVCNLTM